MTKSLFSKRTRDILGAVLQKLALLAGGATAYSPLDDARRSRANTQVSDVMLEEPHADGSGAMSLHPEECAGVLAPQLLSLLQLEQTVYARLAAVGLLSVTIAHTRKPVLPQADLGEGRELYRMEMIVDVHAHPILPSARHQAHRNLVLHRDDTNLNGSQIETIISDRLLGALQRLAPLGPLQC